MSAKVDVEKDQDKMIENEKEKSTIMNSIIEGFHFMLCIMFFTITLILTIKLTISLVNMDVPDDDTNAMTAKQLMTSAVVISYLFDLFIILGVVGFWIYGSYHPENYMTQSEKIKHTTGSKNIYIAFRVMIFSMLMCLSIIMSSLCFAAAAEINDSKNSDQYSDQYNECLDLGKTFMLHFILFTVAQGCTFLFKGSVDIGAVPSQLVDTMTLIAQ
jgi:hypothetical protein